MKIKVTKKYDKPEMWWNFFIGEKFEVENASADFAIVKFEFQRIYELLPSYNHYDEFVIDKKYCKKVVYIPGSIRRIRTIRKL